MQVHYGEGVANHTDPESCAAYREACGEALTGERAGQPLSHGKYFSSRTPTHWCTRHGRQNGRARHRECPNGPAWSETLWHARTTTLPWEPGDLQFGHSQSRRGPCQEGEEP